MSIAAIGNRFYNSQFVRKASEVLDKVKRVYNGNTEAQQEVHGTAILVGAGAIKGMLFTGILTAVFRQFTAAKLFLGGLAGGGIGTLISLPIILTFFSNLNERNRRLLG